MSLRLLLGLIAGSCAADRFNILSLDSAKYKGYMTANFVNYMETRAYLTAQRDKCLPDRKSEKVAMPELFDMIAGSETGAIIASSLVIPNDDPDTKDAQKNKYFATTSLDFFDQHVDTLYHDA